MIAEEYRMGGTCVIRGWCRKSSGAAFAAVSRRTVISSTPSTLATLRLEASGCNSLMRLASLWR